MRYFKAITEVAKSFVIPRVNIELFAWHFEFDSVVFPRNGGAKINVDDVVAFGSPGNIVGVAEGVDLESADIGWEESEVLS